MEIIGFVFIMIFFGGIIGFLAYDTVVSYGDLSDDNPVSINYYYGEDEDDEVIDEVYEYHAERNKPVFFDVG